MTPECRTPSQPLVCWWISDSALFTGYRVVMSLATKHDLTLDLRDLERRMIKIMVTLTALNIGANALIFTFLA